MKKFFPALILLGILILVGLLWRFFQIRAAEQGQTASLVTELDRFGTQAFFSLGNTPITPVLVGTVILFIVLITIGSAVSKRFIRRVLLKTHLDEGQRYAIEVGTGYVVFTVGLLIFLQSAGLNLSSLAVVGGAVGVGVGFGLQNIFNNFVSGLILLVERPIKMGDRVQVQSLLGDIVRIGARSTWVRTNDGIIIIVPNSDFIANSVTNWTASDRQIRVSVPIGVAYESDLRKVREILLHVAKANKDVMSEPVPDVILTEFADSSINFSLRVWTSSQVRTTNMLKSDLYFAIHHAFAENTIEIPFPQRDLHIKSSLAIPLAFNGTQRFEAPDRTPE